MRRLLLALGMAASLGCDYVYEGPTEPIIGSKPPTQISIGSIPDDSDETSEIGFRPAYFTFNGIATDDTFAPLGFVNVCWNYYGCAMTGRDGSYAFNWSSQSNRAPEFPFRLCLTATRDGFETRTECVDVTKRSAAVTWSPVLRRQPVVPTPY